MNRLTIKQVVLYILSVIVLFSIPIYTIAVNSSTLKGGTEYLFKVQAFDPYDMFRGNYLNIGFEQNEVKGVPTTTESSSSSYSNYTNYYVTIDVGSDGFAYFSGIHSTKPIGTSNYYKTNAYYYSYDNIYRIDTPTRYYMNEKKSLNAEQVYRENLDDTYIKVRVKNGKMVIVGVYVNGKLIDTID